MSLRGSVGFMWLDDSMSCQLSMCFYMQVFKKICEQIPNGMHAGVSGSFAGSYILRLLKLQVFK
jgi:hypothetical protein